MLPISKLPCSHSCTSTPAQNAAVQNGLCTSAPKKCSSPKTLEKEDEQEEVKNHQQDQTPGCEGSTHALQQDSVALQEWASGPCRCADPPEVPEANAEADEATATPKKYRYQAGPRAFCRLTEASQPQFTNLKPSKVPKLVVESYAGDFKPRLFGSHGLYRLTASDLSLVVSSLIVASTQA